MKQNIDRQALDHIKVWSCIVENLDKEPCLQIDRKVTQHKDELVITSMDDSPEESVVSISADSAHILATALLMMDSDE